MECPLCRGTGWRALEAGPAHRVARCDCQRDALVGRRLAEAGIGRRYEHCELPNFLVYPNEGLERAVAAARRFADAFPVVDRGLFLVGPPGIGKTHLAVAVLKHVVRATAARAVFYDVRELLRLIRSTYNPVVKTAEMDVLQPVIDAELVVLDDLGAEKTSEWVEETLNLIVNSRYRERRPTIFTSNYEEKEDATDPDSLFVRVGFRMHSRLYEMCEFLEFDGADYRHRPPNAGPEDLHALWKLQRRPKKLPARAGGPARAELRDRPSDLKWPGGRAGSQP
jgi:DNA replication protein DnaC